MTEVADPLEKKLDRSVRRVPLEVDRARLLQRVEQAVRARARPDQARGIPHGVGAARRPERGRAGVDVEPAVRRRSSNESPQEQRTMHNIKHILSRWLAAAGLVACGGGQKTDYRQDSAAARTFRHRRRSGAAICNTRPARPSRSARSRRTRARPTSQARRPRSTRLDKAGNAGTSRRVARSADKFQSSRARTPSSSRRSTWLASRTSAATCSMADADQGVHAGRGQACTGPVQAGARAVEPRRDLLPRKARLDGAKQYWDQAIKANGKLVAAHQQPRRMDIEQMRRVGDKSPEWKKLEDRREVPAVVGARRQQR